MISFFRRALSSWIVLGLLGLILVAFIVTGVALPDGYGPVGGGGDRIARIGKESLTSNIAQRRIDMALNIARQQNPAIDIREFVAAGGVEQVIDQYVSSAAMEQWARERGIGVSERQIDAEIIAIPAFAGPTGQFDRDTMLAVLGRQRLTEAQLRADVASDLIRRQLLLPVGGGTNAPRALVTPYAALLLEAREGMAGIVPVAAMPKGPAPTDAEIQKYYRDNIARYTIGERRIIKYALLTADNVKVAAPSEAEIAAFYKSNAAAYGGKQTRAIQQLVLPDEKAARDFVAKVKGGADFTAAAQAAGLSPTGGDKEKAAYARETNAALADAAFAAGKGAIVGPVKDDLGWYVARIDDVRDSAGRSAGEAREEIVASLTRQKADEALSAKVATIEETIADGASLEEVARANGLAIVTTPAILPNGSAPDQPGYTAPPEVQLLLKAAFEVAPDDDPTVETIGRGERFALMGVDRVIAPAPAPLARIRDQVVGQIEGKRALDRARQIANAIVEKLRKGTPMAQAFASAGVPLPAPRPVSGRQMDLSRNDRQASEALASLFTMKRGDVRLLPAEEGAGWYITMLNTVIPGDVAKEPSLVEATAREFQQVLGTEYAQQFGNAVSRAIGVERDPKAIARLKASLSGQQP
jgi:peptidyl-prolyl cis-trans isomerase D